MWVCVRVGLYVRERERKVQHTTPLECSRYHWRFWFTRTSGLKLNFKPSSLGGGTQLQALCTWFIHLWKLPLRRWFAEGTTFAGLGHCLGATWAGTPAAFSEFLLLAGNGGAPPSFLLATSIVLATTHSSEVLSLNITVPLQTTSIIKKKKSPTNFLHKNLNMHTEQAPIDPIQWTMLKQQQQ